MVVWALLCHSCWFDCHQRVLQTFSDPSYLRSEDGVVWLWHSLVNLYIGLTISSCYDYIPLTLGLIGEYGGLSTLVSYLRVYLSAEGTKNVCWPWLSPLQGWGILTMYIYIYIYIYSSGIVQVLRFLFKPSFTMLCPSLKYEGIFFQKELPKTLFMGETFGETLWRGYMEGLMIRS